VYPVCNCSFETPSYAENADGYMLTKGAMEWFWAHYLDGADGLVPDASPLQVTDLTGLPPALVITAEFDPLRDEGEAYADRLRDAGVPTKMTRYDGMIHGFVGMALVLAQGGQALDEIGAALRDAFAAA
jgi:acetyl esterase